MLAAKRMFSLAIADTDLFLEMPSSTQALYLASKLFITLTEGCGYDKICTFASVPARKTDYQAYLRKALKILNDMLLLKNMPADFPAEKYSETDFQK